MDRDATITSVQVLSRTKRITKCLAGQQYFHGVQHCRCVSDRVIADKIWGLITTDFCVKQYFHVTQRVINFARRLARIGFRESKRRNDVRWQAQLGRPESQTLKILVTALEIFQDDSGISVVAIFVAVKFGSSGTR